MTKTLQESTLLSHVHVAEWTGRWLPWVVLHKSIYIRALLFAARTPPLVRASWCSDARGDLLQDQPEEKTLTSVTRVGDLSWENRCAYVRIMYLDGKHRASRRCFTAFSVLQHDAFHSYHGHVSQTHWRSSVSARNYKEVICKSIRPFCRWKYIERSFHLHNM